MDINFDISDSQTKYLIHKDTQIVNFNITNTRMKNINNSININTKFPKKLCHLSLNNRQNIPEECFNFFHFPENINYLKMLKMNKFNRYNKVNIIKKNDDLSYFGRNVNNNKMWTKLKNDDKSFDELYSSYVL